MKKFKNIILGLFVFVFIILLTGCGKKDDVKKEKLVFNKDKDNGVVAENIGYSSSGDYLIKVKNTTNEERYVAGVTVDFYDDNNKIVKKNKIADNILFFVPAKGEIITYVHANGDDNFNNLHGKINLDLNSVSAFKKLYNDGDFKFDIKKTADRNAMNTVTVTNNTPYNIHTFNFNVIYYKDDKVMSVSAVYVNDFQANSQVIKDNVLLPMDINGFPLDFYDRVEYQILVAGSNE